jgi:predicted CXXCH cytochrome family protein
LCLCGDHSRDDPAAWGGDHVGKAIPEFITGDECLFCHRQDIGPAWGKNRHNLTVREASGDELKKLGDLAKEATLVMGGARHARFLKPSAEFGKLDLLTTDARPQWDAKTFAAGCAGCHCTALDAKTRAFTSRSLECYVCHGANSVDHTMNPTLVHLAKKRNDPPRVVISICAQCHIRDGKSKSTGLSYPNQFVAGDNLFRDFQVDFSDEHLNKLNPADRHVLENVRDVVERGGEDMTCLSCHDVHKQSSRKHQFVAKGDICLNCHHADQPKKVLKAYEVHSKTCGY